MTGQLSKENINKHQKIKDMNKQTIISALIAVLVGLVSCSSDNDYEDKVEQVTVYVSAETGMFYNVPNTTLEEGMMIRVDGEENYICVAFNTIAGFTYEKGNEYELLVKKTKLPNPPKDSGSIRYELIRIVSQRVDEHV